MKRPIAEWRKDLVKRKRVVPVKVMRDGREICNLKTSGGKGEYKIRTYLMAIRQNWICGLRLSGCDLRLCLKNMTFEHVDGRGMGGSRRDDRIEKDGKPYNLAACWTCNANKGSKRLSRATV